MTSEMSTSAISSSSSSSSSEVAGPDPCAPSSSSMAPAPRDLRQKRPLEYRVHAYSSYSANFPPDNILVDRPSDQSSRWSSDTNSPLQYLTLQLARTAVVCSITFGKYEKTHVCNLKRFKVYGGADRENMVEILDGGLRNDSTPETFRLLHTAGGQFVPCRYIKIVPMQSWGPSFNFSVWYVGLKGDDSPKTVMPAIKGQQEFREREAIRLCLKHFRHHEMYEEVFDCLQRKTRIRLEDTRLTDLHRLIVKDGQFERAEDTVQKAIQDGLFDRWSDNIFPTPIWTPFITLKDCRSSLPPPPPFTESASPNTPPPLPPPPSSAAMAPSGSGSTSGSQTPAAEERLEQRVPPPDGDEAMDEESPLDGGSRQLPGGGSGIGDDDLPPLMGAAPGAPVIQQPPAARPKVPGCRGGHQLVIDSETQIVYLFGGWDGERELSDFWEYNIVTNTWRLLSLDAQAEGGPGPRSCHKMELDTKHKQIFVLGKYLERRSPREQCKNDFYVYDIASSSWTQITDDTSAMGGPRVIFDHQMCIDVEKRVLYVFGGYALSSVSDMDSPVSVVSSLHLDRSLSGFYEYHIPTNTWTKKSGDSCSSNAAAAAAAAANSNPRPEIMARASHSMLFHQGLRKLFIFGGQRKRDEFLNDFFSYSVDTGEVEIISTGVSQFSTMPAVGQTQRATIDWLRNEIHVMTGLSKDESDKTDPTRVNNSFWVYNISQNKWTCVYKNDNSCLDYWNRMQDVEPRPRYAHQLVYDEINRLHFMFGGNPGNKPGKDEHTRLGDFWQLRLSRPSREEMLRRCRLLIRRAQFIELTWRDDKAGALHFLQNRLSEVTNHDDPEEKREFQLSASKLFQVKPSPSSIEQVEDLSNWERHTLRNNVFDALSSFFPDSMAYPRQNLIDLIPFSMDRF